MDQTRPDQSAVRSSFVIVLYGTHEAGEVQRIIQKAEPILDRLAVDYEILVLGEVGNTAAEQAVQEAAQRNPGVQFVPSSQPESYAAALRVGLTASQSGLIALTDGSADLSALQYLIPLAETHPIVHGYRSNRHDPLLDRLLAWAGNLAARFLTGTGIRVGGTRAVLTLFQCAALKEIVPQAEDPFAQTETLARARGQDFAIVEVPLVGRSPSAPGPRRSWRSVAAVLSAWLTGWWHFQFSGPAAAPPRKASWLLGLLLAGLAALLLGPSNQPLLEPDEGRQAEIPREMLVYGDFLLPRIQGQPYYEKPPLQYWLTSGAYSLFGVHPWVARLVPATAAWFAVVLTFAWARRHFTARQALLGGLVLCLSVEFVILGRTVVLDSLLTLCVVASWYAAHAAVSGPVFRWSGWSVSALACGLGILAKGPVALILLVPPVVAYQFLTSNRPRWTAWMAYAGLALLVPAPWYSLMALRDPAYLSHFFWKANVVRFVNPYDHEQPWWFYLPVLFLGTFPWSLLVMAVGYFLGSKKPALAALRTRPLGYCVLLAGWCLLFFSLSGCKSPPYILPAFAPLALLTGVCLDGILFLPVMRQYPFLAHARQALPCHATIAILLLTAAAYVALALLGWLAWEEAVGPAVGTLVLPVLCWRFGRRLRPVVAWGMCAAAMLGFLLFPTRDLSAGYAARHSPATIARLIRHSPARRKSPVVSVQRTWQSASFYLRREVASYYGERLHKDLEELINQEPEVLVLVENGQNLADFLNELPPTLEKEVVLPDPDGTVALVVVRKRAQP
jgi:dolichol-phosphate mannosyltransferase